MPPLFCGRGISFSGFPSGPGAKIPQSYPEWIFFPTGVSFWGGNVPQRGNFLRACPQKFSFAPGYPGPSFQLGYSSPPGHVPRRAAQGGKNVRTSCKEVHQIPKKPAVIVRGLFRSVSWQNHFPLPFVLRSMIFSDWPSSGAKTLWDLKLMLHFFMVGWNLGVFFQPENPLFGRASL